MSKFFGSKLSIVGAIGAAFIFISDYLFAYIGITVGNVLFVDKLSISIYFLTLLAILWYSKETQELKEASIKRPCLSFNRNDRIFLKNYGEGVARDVEIFAGDKIIHKIPLISSIYSDCNKPLPFSEEINLRLMMQRQIKVVYYDINRIIRYTTTIEWDNSKDNRDGCRIIEYNWKTVL